MTDEEFQLENYPPEAFGHDTDCGCNGCLERSTACERCDGTGTMKLTGFISYVGGRCETAHDKPMRCTECYGTGEISGLTRKQRRIAEYIRKGRIALNVTQGEQAKIVGMSFSDWNAILRGRSADDRTAAKTEPDLCKCAIREPWLAICRRCGKPHNADGMASGGRYA